jgi:hypothetical protein
MLKAVMIVLTLHAEQSNEAEKLKEVGGGG